MIYGSNIHKPEIIIFLSIPIGFVIQSFYRILYHYLAYGKRSSLIYFQSRVRSFPSKDFTFKRLGIDTINNPSELEKVYFLYVFSNPKFKNWQDHIYKRSVALSCLWPVLISIGIGIMLGIYFKITPLFYGIYTIIGALSFMHIMFTTKEMNDKEKYLIDKAFQEKIFQNRNLFIK